MATSISRKTTSTKRATSTAKPLMDANSDNPLEASIARARSEEVAAAAKPAAKTTPAKKPIGARAAVAKVLADGAPRTSKEITSAAAKIAGLAGKTPEASLRALLSTEAKKADGLVVRTEQGEYALRATA
jgi:hypothetical protein